MKGNWLLATVLGMSLSVSAALPEASAKQLPILSFVLHYQLLQLFLLL